MTVVAVDGGMVDSPRTQLYIFFSCLALIAQLKTMFTNLERYRGAPNR